MISSNKFELENRNLYLCTGIRPDLTFFIEQVIKGGVDVVQLRDKTADAKSIIKHAREVKKVTSEFGIPFFINDRPDIALEVGADGVHVGQEDIPVEIVKKIIPSALIGLSTHSENELQDSLTRDVDYISAGPITPTPTKPGRKGTGIEYPSRASTISPRPVFVTGGVEPSIIKELVANNITHFVVVRYLTEATDPFLAAKTLRRAVDEALQN